MYVESSLAGTYSLNMYARHSMIVDITDWARRSVMGTGRVLRTDLLTMVTAMAVVMWKATVAATDSLDGDWSAISLVLDHRRLCIIEDVAW